MQAAGATCRPWFTTGSGLAPMHDDSERFREVRLPHLALVHWIVNPGVAFAELVLGQRVPKRMLIEPTSRLGGFKRSLIPCEACGAQHDGMLWSGWNGFGHWLGLVCPTCESRIPCLWNLTSIVILAVTSPLWIGPKLLLEERWLRWELHRLDRQQLGIPLIPAAVIFALAGAAFGLAIAALAVIDMSKKTTLTPVKIGAAVVAGLIAGAFFAAGMWFFSGRRGGE